MSNDTSLRDAAWRRKDHQQDSERYSRLQRAFLAQERAHKVEMAVVGFIWLVGCPVLCVFFSSDSMYGTPFPVMCGLYSYSISASMTGYYPKILGSLMATLFAILVVQRTATGLCACLKLGWLRRYSPFFSPELATNLSTETTLLAQRLWTCIIRIESLGYLAGVFLISLVVFDAQSFPSTHNALATLAFTCMTAQNYLVGTLEQSFPTVFVNWRNTSADLLFWIAVRHWTILGVSMYGLGTIHHFDKCHVVTTILESTSSKLFGTPDTWKWLASVALWYTEYAFVVLCIYIQLLESYETFLWEFVGQDQMPITGILPRFSLYLSFKRLLKSDCRASLYLETQNEDQSGDSSTTGENKRKLKVG